MAARFGKWPRHYDEREMILPADTADVLVGVRDYLNEHPWAVAETAARLGSLVWINRYLPYPPEAHEVKAALEVLTLEREKRAVA